MTTSSSSSSSTRTTSPSEPPVCLNEYRHFHGMLCSPSTACRAIRSFQHGCVLFMPFNYSRDEFVSSAAFSPPTEQQQQQQQHTLLLSPNRYKVQHLNVWTYYLLVIFSLTGLSTLLGLTQTNICREEQNIRIDNNQQPLTAISFAATTTTTTTDNDDNDSTQPSLLSVDPCVLHYIQQRHGSRGGITPLYLVRRFEFEFKLASIAVVMFHIRSGGGEDENDENDPPKLHLVEVYHIQNPMLRAVIGTLLTWSKWITQNLIKRFLLLTPWQQQQQHRQQKQQEASHVQHPKSI